MTAAMESHMSFEMQGAAMELEARTHWALARLAELVNLGRAAAWLPGEVIADVRPAESFLSIATTTETPMRWLANRLGLSSIETDVLWLLVCIELDPKVARAAQLVMSPGMSDLDAQVIERLATRGRVFDDAVLERLAQLGLVETSFDHRVPMYRRAIRSSDRVVELARGRAALDRELTAFAAVADALELRRQTANAVPVIPAELTRALASGAPALLVAKGCPGSGRATALRHAVACTGRGIIAVRTSGLAREPITLARQLRALARECRLHDAFPLLLDIDDISERAEVIDRELLQGIQGPVLATGKHACTWSVSRAVVTAEIQLPGSETRKQLWRRALPNASEAVTTALAHRYQVTPGMLNRVASTVSTAEVTTQAVHTAVRVQIERSLDGLAQRIETRQTWDDLVLPLEQFDTLIELVARMRYRHQVLETWGFAEKIGRGLGLSTLLSGPPGTGKTMIAGLLARELGLDLYQVDLSRIVSKYIGETEKQLAALFEAAESGHAILLFDEADSLFAKRTEVKSSNDRYANLEVNYLLQRMESFSGVSILTTNHETSIDPAFMRRLAFHIRVPMPDDTHRALIWRAIIPRQAECAADVDFDGLASEFTMSGGYIKNAALRAAFLAANHGQPITNAHLWQAARSEYEAMGKVAFHLPARLCAL